MDERLSKKIYAELENIDEVFKEIPSSEKLPYLSTLELAGTAALLHNFYNGIENILKRIFLSENIEIPEGKSSHKELIETAVKKQIISEELKNTLGEYLAFRHFFSHAYAFDLYADKMEPLVQNSKEVYSNFKKEITKYL
jgi:uncharacterized protein YutE (UPF0331/DUF86 family)